MTRLAAVVVFSSAVVLSAQAPDPLALLAGTSAIRGRVLASSTDTPLRNARVELQRNDQPFSVVMTDGSGRFAAANLPAGRYVLAAAKPGFVKSTLLTPAGTPRRIDVADGATVEGIDLSLPKAGSIAGRILDETGEPVSGAQVTADSGGARVLTSAFGEGVRTFGETDDLGVYRIGGLADGRFVISVWLPLAGMAKNGLLVLTASPVSQTDTVVHGLTDAAGPGAGLRILNPRYYYPGVQEPSQAQAIEVLAGEERTAIDFGVPGNEIHTPMASALARPGEPNATADIQGRVLRADGRPIPRAQVRLDPIDATRIVLGTLTDDDGRYAFGNVRAGEYTVTANSRGYIDAEYGQRRAFEHGDTIVLASGEKRDRVDVTLPRYGAVAGRVLDEYGDAVEGARVELMQIRFQAGRLRLVEARAATKLTDDLGHYRVHDVPPGQYVVRALVGQADLRETMGHATSMANIPGYAPTYYPGTPTPSDARLLTIGVSQDLVEIDFPLVRVPTARISGHAFTSTGETVKGGLQLVPSDRSGAIVTTPIAPTRSFARTGSFEFSNLPPGEYVVQATMGRPNLAGEGEFAAQYVAVNGTDLDDLVIRTSPGSTISGRVTFEGGADPPGPREIGLAPVSADPDSNPRFNDPGPFGAGPPGRSEVLDDFTFEIAGINGARRLRLTSPPAGWALKAIYSNGADVTDQIFRFGTPNQSVRDLQVVLTGQPTAVEGIASNAQGRPAHDCLVVAFPADRDLRFHQSRYLDHSTCQRDGSYIIRRLPPGQYLIAAIEKGSIESGDEWQDPRLLDAIAQNALRLTLVEGQKVSLPLRILAR